MQAGREFGPGELDRDPVRRHVDHRPVDVRERGFDSATIPPQPQAA
jgi:hypothetical protein